MRGNRFVFLIVLIVVFLLGCEETTEITDDHCPDVATQIRQAQDTVEIVSVVDGSSVSTYTILDENFEIYADCKTVYVSENNMEHHFVIATAKSITFAYDNIQQMGPVKTISIHY